MLVVDDFLLQEAARRPCSAWSRGRARGPPASRSSSRRLSTAAATFSAWPVPVASLAAIVSVDNGYIELLEEESFDDAGILDIATTRTIRAAWTSRPWAATPGSPASLAHAMRANAARRRLSL